LYKLIIFLFDCDIFTTQFAKWKIMMLSTRKTISLTGAPLKRD